jgi:LuxR family maltose regulon positive regulatory protein
VEQLERQRQRPLILVSAPAGFGKSTLLSAWLEASDWPSAWLSLDEQDSDLVTFVTYFIAAIQMRFPDVGQETLALLNAPALPPLPVLTASLNNELARVDQPFILVLDDYHVIHEPAIHTLIAELLRHPPRALHLAMATRRDPPLPLSELRARAKMTEIRSPDLRFSSEECQAFLQRMLDVDVDQKTATALAESTEGWAAGLRLVALSLPNIGRVGDGSELVLAQQANANNLFVMDYLVSEVLTQQPPEIQEFVLKTSILNRMCGPLCEAVMGLIEPGRANASIAVSTGRGQRQLERIQNANLFVIPMARDEQGQWYRYHHLFHEFLQRHLKHSCSRDEIGDLHRRAGEWLAQHGLIEDALHHLIAAGDYAHAVRLVDQHRHALMNDEQWHRLERWIGLFPRDVVEQRPEFLLTEAWIARSNARWLDMPAKIEQAERLVTQLTAQSSQPAGAALLGLQGELDCLHSYQYLVADDPSPSLFHAQRALGTTPLEWWSARLLARLNLAGGLHYSGDDKRALATMYEGMTEQSLQNHDYQSRLLVSAALVHVACADLDGLLHAAGQALALSEKHDRPETMCWAHYLSGEAHYWRNELSDAEGHVASVVAHRYLANAQCVVQSACVLALTFQAQGRSDKAREIADLAVDFTLEINHPYQLSVARAFQAELAVRQGRLADAQRYLAHYEVPAVASAFLYNASTTVAKILVAANSTESRATAAGQLSKLVVRAEAINEPRAKMEALALQALLFDGQGDRVGALASLSQAVTLAQPSRFIRLFADFGPQMGNLLKDVHASGIAMGFVEQILAAIGQAKSVAASVRRDGLIEQLTDRELEVLGLLAQRLSDKEIAERLIISAGTVKRHTHNIYEKLDVGSRRDAVAKAESLGLLGQQAEDQLSR